MLVRKRVQNSEASNGTGTTPTSIWFSTLAEFNLHLTDGDLRVVDEAGNPYDTKTTPSKLGFKAEQANAVYAVLADLLKGELRKGGLEATRLPLGAKQDEPHCLILHSPQAFTTTGRVLIFALGSGDFLGCWNRSNLLQKGLKAGSVLPYVQQARDEGYEVIILNLDENYLWNRRTMVDIPSTGQVSPIPRNDAPRSHMAYVLDNIIKPCPSTDLAFVTNYDGSLHLIGYLSRDPDHASFLNRIRRLAMFNTTHSIWDDTPQAVQDWLSQETHCRNWVENSELGDGVLLPDVSDNQAVNVRLADHTLRSALQTREQAAVFDFLRGTPQA